MCHGAAIEGFECRWLLASLAGYVHSILFDLPVGKAVLVQGSKQGVGKAMWPRTGQTFIVGQLLHACSNADGRDLAS